MDFLRRRKNTGPAVRFPTFANLTAHRLAVSCGVTFELKAEKILRVSAKWVVNGKSWCYEAVGECPLQFKDWPV